jgi:hypothetical protein
MEWAPLISGGRVQAAAVVRGTSAERSASEVYPRRAPGSSSGWDRPLGHLNDERLRWLPDVSVLK